MVDMNSMPKLVLDKEQTLAYIAEKMDGCVYDDWSNVKSTYLCEYLNALESEGYVYNLPAQRRFEADHGLPELPPNASILSGLIYMAQSFRDIDKYRDQGFVTASKSLLEAAFKANKKLLTPSGHAYTVRLASDGSGDYWVFQPRVRNRRVLLGANPVKLG